MIKEIASVGDNYLLVPFYRSNKQILFADSIITEAMFETLKNNFISSDSFWVRSSNNKYYLFINCLTKTSISGDTEIRIWDVDAGIRAFYEKYADGAVFIDKQTLSRMDEYEETALLDSLEELERIVYTYRY